MELQTFKSAAVEGHEDRIHKLTMARLDAGDASLVVEGVMGEIQLSEGRLVGVRAPSDCLPRYARNELELMPGYISDIGEERPEIEKELKTRCLYEGAIYEDGSQWSATHQQCQMCSCRRWAPGTARMRAAAPSDHISPLSGARWFATISCAPRRERGALSP